MKFMKGMKIKPESADYGGCSTALIRWLLHCLTSVPSVTSVVKPVFLRYYWSHFLDFYTIFKQLSGQSVQYRPARTALQQNTFPYKDREQPFLPRKARKVHESGTVFHHRGHRVHRDKTSQRIIAGVPAAIRWLFVSFASLAPFALNRSLYSSRFYHERHEKYTKVEPFFTTEGTENSEKCTSPWTAWR